jgi:hypothetical protein
VKQLSGGAERGYRYVQLLEVLCEHLHSGSCVKLQARFKDVQAFSGVNANAVYTIKSSSCMLLCNTAM